MLNMANPPQGYTELQLVNLALHQLATSRYGEQIKLIVNSYHGNTSAFPTLDSLVNALRNHDIFDGKDFGGAPLASPKTPYRPASPNYTKYGQS